MKKINVQCPECERFRRILVPEEMLDNPKIEGDLLVLRIKPGEVCDHEFDLLLDWHFAVRGYRYPVED